MDKIIRRTVFSRDKRVMGYFYFIGESLSDYDKQNSSVLAIMRELLYAESRSKDNAKIIARIGIKDLDESVYAVLPKERSILDITDVVNSKKGISEIISKGYKMMIYVEKEEDLSHYDYVEYIRCDIKSNNFEKIVSKAKELNKKIIVCGINTTSLYGKAERYNPDCYEGQVVSEQQSLTGFSTFYLESTVVKLLELLNNDVFLVDEIVHVIQTDSKMTTTVLQIVNTMEYGGKNNKFDRIQDAVLAIGKETLYNLLILAKQNTTEDETYTNMIKMDFFRSEFSRCINANIKYGLFGKSKYKRIDSEDAYKIGLFCHTDIFYRKPMSEVVKSLNQSSVVEDALIYKDGPGGTILKLIIAYDKGEKDKIEQYANDLGISLDKLENIYREAIIKTNSIWSKYHENSKES